MFPAEAGLVRKGVCVEALRMSAQFAHILQFLSRAYVRIATTRMLDWRHTYDNQ